MMERLTLVLAAVVLPCSAYALDVLQAYDLARRNDPAYLAAQHERAAGETYRDQGRAGLLPSVGYTYTQARNDSDVTRAISGVSTQERRDYRSYSSAITLEQPLFDMAAWSRYRLGEAQSSEAESRFAAQTQALATRVLTAYLAALFARDQLQLARNQEATYRKLLEQNQRLLKEGEGTLTDATETESLVYAAQAETIDAEDAVDAALYDLQRLVGRGVAPGELPTLKDGVANLPMFVQSLEAWQDLALANSPLLAAQRSIAEAAGYDIRRQQAGHTPRVSLYVSNRRSESESETTFGQSFNTTSVGVRVSLPIFSGGSVLASTRQAVETEAQRLHEMDAARAEVMGGVRRNYRRVASSAGSLSARAFSVRFAAERIRATELSVAGGERVNQDVLDAQRQWYMARRDQARTRYDYLQAWLDMHTQAGVLEYRHLESLASQFSMSASP